MARPADASLRAFVNALRGGRPSAKRIASARSHLTSNTILAALRWLDGNPYYRPFIAVEPARLGPQEFFKREPLASLTDEFELAWYGAQIIKYGETLRKHVVGLNEIQRNVLCASYITAVETLDRLIEQCGYSLWGAELALALAEYEGGPSRRRDKLATLQRTPGTPLTNFFLSVASLRVDRSWTPSVFATAISDAIKELPPDDFTEYIQVHSAASYRASPRQLLDTLRWEATASLVDLYEGYVAYCCAVAANDGTSAPAHVPPLLTRVMRATGDQRLAVALTLMRGRLSSDVVPSAASLALNRAIAQGRGAEALDRGEELYTSLDALGLAARAVAIDPPAFRHLDGIDALGKQILAALSGIMAGERVEDLAVVLAKVASDWRPLPFSTWVEGVVARELADDPLESTIASRSAACCGRAADPLRLDDVAIGSVRDLGRDQVSLIGDGPWIATRQHDLSDDRRCDAERQLGIIANSRGEVALAAAQRLANNASPFYRLRGVRVNALTLLRNERSMDAVRYIVSNWIQDTTSQSLLPVRSSALQVLKASRTERREISRPILLDIAARAAGEPFATARTVALEQLLAEWDVECPSDLLVFKDSFNHDELLYLLRSVCSEQILDATALFTRTPEVIDERLTIVKGLIDVDPTGASDYQAEAKELFRRNAVRKRKRQLEQSKIYLEVDGIKVSASKRVRDNYVRLRTVLKTGLDRLIMIVRDSLGAREGEDRLSGVTIGVNDLLQDIIGAVRDEFVSSTDHGLEGFVSLRIRHGTLKNELRAPFEARHLITTRDQSDEYESNDFWLSNLDTATARFINTSLGRMSRSVDGLITELKSQWLQVKRTANDPGMFDFVVDEAWLQRIRAKIDKNTDLDELIALLVQDLFQVLEASLSRIRKRIADEAKNRALRALDELEADVSGDAYVDLLDLRTAVRLARTDVQRAFDRVVEWFRVSETAPSEPFLVDEAISIAIDVLHLSHSIEVMKDGAPDVLLRGERFNAFVDVFIIVFQNIAAHSHLARPSATIEFDADDERLRVRITNPVADGVATLDNRRKVADIQERLVRSGHRLEVAREGGTGFFKIWNIFSHHLRVSSPMIDFGFAASTFFVDVEFPWEVCLHASADR